MTYLDSHVIKIHFLFKDHIIIIAKTIVYRSFKKKKGKCVNCRALVITSVVNLTREENK